MDYTFGVSAKGGARKSGVLKSYPEIFDFAEGLMQRAQELVPWCPTADLSLLRRDKLAKSEIWAGHKK